MTIKACQMGSFPPVRSAGKARVMQALTPASDGDLSPLAELAASEPFWRYPAGTAGRKASRTFGPGLSRPSSGEICRGPRL